MKIISTLILLVLSSQLHANDGLYMQTGLEVSNPIIQPEYRPENTSETSNNYAAQLTLGYQFKNNIVVEGGVIYHGAVDFLGSSDHSSINEYALLAGYSFDISERWNLIPKVGYSRWKLDSTEGWILNPGDEAQKTTSGSYFPIC